MIVRKGLTAFCYIFLFQAFPRNSPLVSTFSKAILNITQNKTTYDRIKSKYFSSDIISVYESTSPSDNPNLTVESFGGLFIITLFTSVLALLVHLFKFLHSKWTVMRTINSDQRAFSAMMIELGKHFNKEDRSLHPSPNREVSRTDPAATPGTEGNSPTRDAIVDQSRI